MANYLLGGGGICVERTKELISDVKNSNSLLATLMVLKTYQPRIELNSYRFLEASLNLPTGVKIKNAEIYCLVTSVF